ncbi:MAG: glycosyltransferase [Deltaproteobacteria bacterium]|nr:glycosyltransferase [Deltaproteobacteria bacterium]
MEKAALCFCNSNLAWGGGERWHLTAARHFASQGYTVTLAAGRESALGLAAARLLEREPGLALRLRLADWRFGNLDFLRPIKMARFAHFLHIQGIRRLILALPADLKAGAAAVRFLSPSSRPDLFYRRGSAIPVSPTWTNRFFYGALRGVIANSQETARGVMAGGKLIAPSKISVIYNGVEAEEFDRLLADQTGDTPSPRRGGPDRALVIGNAGRLTKQKGHKYLLHMSAELKKRGVRHRLLMAGSGELLEDLEKLAARLGLEAGRGLDSDKEVVFAGFMENMAPFWRKIDIFVLGSLWEGFGYVLAEAMLAQKPICAFNCNSMPELVLEGQNGFLAAPPQPGEDEAAGGRLAEMVLRLHAKPDLAHGLGRAGRALCLERFSQKKAMAALERVLDI